MENIYNCTICQTPNDPNCDCPMDGVCPLKIK